MFKKSPAIPATSSLLTSSLIIAIASLASRFLGLYRDRLLAGTYGAGDTLDIYYASFRIPDLIFNLLILGALNSAFIPVFKQLLAQRQTKQAFTTANNLLNTILIFLAIFSSLVFVFALPFTTLITPGFTGDKLVSTANLTRLMLLSPLFFSLSAISGGILNSFNRFISYSLAPIFYNLGIIFGIILLTPYFGIYGLGLGVIIGAALNFFTQLPELIQSGFHYQPIFDLHDKFLRRIISLMIPTTLSLAITQINLTVDTIIGSTLASGSIAVFNFASNIQTLPVGIFAIPICTTIFPVLVELLAKNNTKDFNLQISRSSKQILFIIIPASIFLYVFRAQIVRILLGTGAFDWENTRLTLTTLGFFAISLPFQALLPLLIRGFYATQNTYLPLTSSIVGMVINVILSIIFSEYLGVAGLALAFSCASISNFLIANYLFHRYKPGFHFYLAPTIYKIIISSIFAGFVAHLSLRLFEPYFNNQTFVGLFLQTATSSIMGIGTYLILAFLTGIQELNTILFYLKKKFL